MLDWQKQGLLQCIPELAALQGTAQDPQWHPEGDVWIHTVHVCNFGAKISQRDKLGDSERQILLLACLCHDFGKPKTTRVEEGRYRSPGHANISAKMSQSFLKRIAAPSDLIAKVPPLVGEHLAHSYLKQPNRRQVRRLLQRLSPASFPQLLRLIEADLGGRPPLSPGLPASMLEARSLAEELEKERRAEPALLNGTHLKKIGLQPGPEFREILDDCYQAQLAGKFTTVSEGLQFLQVYLQRKEKRDSPTI